MSEVRNESDFFNFSIGNWALEDFLHRVILLTWGTCLLHLFSLSYLIVRIFDRSPEDKHLKKESKASFWAQIKMIWASFSDAILSGIESWYERNFHFGLKEFQFEL